LVFKLCSAIVDGFGSLVGQGQNARFFEITTSERTHFWPGLSGSPVFASDTQPPRLLGVVSTIAENGARAGCIAISEISEIDPEAGAALERLLVDSGDSWMDPQMPALELPWQERQPLLGGLREALFPSNATPGQPVALVGLGGVGKTQLAVWLVSSRPRDLEFVWWLKASSNSTVVADLERLCRCHKIEVDSAGPIAAAGKWLARHNNWVLVLDDLVDIELFKTAFGALVASGRFLITSRNPNLSNIAEVVQITPFSSGEALTYLQRRRIPEDGSLGSLSESLGYLPMALRQAADYLEATGELPNEYLAKLRSDAVELLSVEALTDPSSAPAGQRTVASVWRSSIEETAVRSLAGLGILRLFAFLGPYPFPRSLLGKDRLSSAIKSLSGAETEISDLDISLGIAAARRLSLLETVGTEGLQMHSLLQRFIKESLDVSTRRFETLTMAERLLGLPDFADENAESTQPALLIPHALEILKNIPVESPAELVEIFKVPDVNAAIALTIMKKLSMSVRNLCERIGDARLLEESWVQSLRCDRKMRELTGDARFMAKTLSRFARSIEVDKIHRKPGEAQSTELLSEARDLAEHYNEDDLMIFVLTDAVDVWRLRGDFESATNCALELEKLARKNEDWLALFVSFDSQMRTLWDGSKVTGVSKEQSFEMLKKCMAGARRQLKLCDDHYVELRRQRPLAIRNLASVLVEMEDLKEGFATIETAIAELEGLENLSPSEEAALFEARRNYFDALLKRQKFRPELLEQEVASGRKRDRTRDVGFVRALHRLAMGYSQADELEKAVVIETEALRALLALPNDYVLSDLRGIYLSLKLFKDSSSATEFESPTRTEWDHLSEQVKAVVVRCGYDWSEFVALPPE